MVNKNLVHGFFEQEEVASSKKALDYLWEEFPNRNNGEIRAMLAKCGKCELQITLNTINNKRCSN